MSKLKNNKKASFLSEIPTESIDLDNNDLATRSKFNFSYFCTQPAGQDFCEWNHADIVKLLNKIKEYTKKPLAYWKHQKLGNHNVLDVYGSFPQKSDFTHPKHVPHQAQWARFRIESTVRLIGFVLPDEYSDTIHKNGSRLDCNCFYVVFLDENHKFYIGKN